MRVLHFSKQEEDIIEHNNVICHMVAIMVNLLTIRVT